MEIQCDEWKMGFYSAYNQLLRDSGESDRCRNKSLAGWIESETVQPLSAVICHLLVKKPQKHSLQPVLFWTKHKSLNQQQTEITSDL